MSVINKLVLYTNRHCPFAARAVLAMAETNQAHEEIQIDLNTPRPDWYLHISPFGRVPALKVNDHDVVLESLFVAEFICDLHPEANLFPQDPLQRAQVRYLVHHWGSYVQPAYHRATFLGTDADAKERHQAYVTELEKFNDLLLFAKRSPRDSGKGQYFLGDQFSFADLALASFLTRVPLTERFQTGFKLPLVQESSKIARFLEWKEAVVSRPTVKRVLPSTDELEQVYRKIAAEKNAEAKA